MAALRESLTPMGYSLDEKSWDASSVDWASYDAVIIGTTWDYWDRYDAFLETLDAITRAGTLLFNPVSLVRWNSRKTYLRELEQKRLKTIPTLWLDHPSVNDLDAALTAWEQIRLLSNVRSGRAPSIRSAIHAVR